jgi:VanZ family protein
MLAFNVGRAKWRTAMCGCPRSPKDFYGRDQYMSGALAINSAESNERSLRKWMPVLVWAIIIFIFSTSYFSAENTSKWIDPILRFLMPGASVTTIALTHGLVRKCAHFINYAILFWLLVSGPMRERPYLAFTVCVVYAFLDEGHQMFVPQRTPSLYDVALDSTGALFSRFLHAAVIEIA